VPALPGLGSQVRQDGAMSGYGPSTHEIEVDGSEVVKRFRSREGDEARREWRALTLLAEFTGYTSCTIGPRTPESHPVRPTGWSPCWPATRCTRVKPLDGRQTPPSACPSSAVIAQRARPAHVDALSLTSERTSEIADYNRLPISRNHNEVERRSFILAHPTRSSSKQRLYRHRCSRTCCPRLGRHARRRATVKDTVISPGIRQCRAER